MRAIFLVFWLGETDSHCQSGRKIMVHMREKTRLLWILLGLAVPGMSSGQTVVNQIGPWKLGMTRAEVEKFDDFGPYIFDAARDMITTKNAVFNERKIPVSFEMKNKVLFRIQMGVYEGDSLSTARTEMVTAIDAMRSGLGLPVLTQADVNTLFAGFERKVNSGFNILAAYRVPGILGVGSMIFKQSTGTFYVTLWSQINSNTAFPEKSLILPLRVPPFTSVARATIDNAMPAATTGAPAPTPSDGLSGLVSVPAASSGKLKASMAKVNALLVKPLSAGGNAAQAMKLTATAVPASGNLTVGFNQPVGPDMRRALGEVVRGIQVKYQELPASGVQLGFADKWGGKDGPSASVACGLLMESLIQGFPIAETLAVTGDMNADLTVQPVGGVPDKIRGAMAAGCTLIGVPAENAEDLNDLVVEEGIGRFLQAQVFTLKTLDDALVLANEESRGEEVRAAMADFLQLQKELQSGGAALLAKPETQDRIVKIGQAMPNHYSAKMLLYSAQRRLPTRYSLVGSLIRIGEAMAPFSTAVKEMKASGSPQKYLFSRNNLMSQAGSKLSALRGKSDERMTKFISAQVSLVTAFQRAVGASDRASFEVRLQELFEAEKRTQREANLFKEDKAIQDEIMRRGGGGGNDQEDEEP